MVAPFAICPSCRFAMHGEWDEERQQARLICEQPGCPSPASGPWRGDLVTALAAYRQRGPH